MADKELIKEFLTALSNNDYVAADKVFPNVVKSALNTVINNKKPTIVEQLNKKAEEIASKNLDNADSDKQQATEKK